MVIVIVRVAIVMDLLVTFINNYLGLNVYGLGFSLDLQQGWQADVCVHACLRVYVNVS